MRSTPLSVRILLVAVTLAPTIADALPAAPLRASGLFEPRAEAAAARLRRPHRPIVGRPLPSHRPIVRPHRPIVVVRPWVHRRHFGRVVAGVVLGTIVLAAVAGSVPAAPAPNLCWYWTDESRTRGYWDYCRY